MLTYDQIRIYHDDRLLPIDGVSSEASLVAKEFILCTHNLQVRKQVTNQVVRIVPIYFEIDHNDEKYSC